MGCYMTVSDGSGVDRWTNLGHDGIEVMLKLVLRGTNVSNTTRLVPWSTCSSKDLPQSMSTEWVPES